MGNEEARELLNKFVPDVVVAIRDVKWHIEFGETVGADIVFVTPSREAPRHVRFYFEKHQTRWLYVEPARQKTKNDSYIRVETEHVNCVDPKEGIKREKKSKRRKKNKIAKQSRKDNRRKK